MGKATACCAAVFILSWGSLGQAAFEAPAQSPVANTEAALARPWSLSIRASVGNSDNVQFVPDSTFFSGDRESSYYALQVSGKYRLYQSPTFSAGAALGLEKLWWQGGSEFSDYNLQVVNPELFAVYRFSAGHWPAALTGSYEFRREQGELEGIGLSSTPCALKPARTRSPT